MAAGHGITVPEVFRGFTGDDELAARVLKAASSVTTTAGGWSVGWPRRLRGRVQGDAEPGRSGAQ